MFLLLKHKNFQPQKKILNKEHLLKPWIWKLMVVSADLDKHYIIDWWIQKQP